MNKVIEWGKEFFWFGLFCYKMFIVFDFVCYEELVFCVNDV